MVINRGWWGGADAAATDLLAGEAGVGRRETSLGDLLPTIATACAPRESAGRERSPRYGRAVTAAVPDDLEPRRRDAQQRLERAVGEGRLTLDEFTDRVGRVWAADDGVAIERLTTDLPTPVVGGTRAGRSVLVSVLGDLKRRGRWSLRRRTTVLLLLGDVDLDLRGAVVEQGTSSRSSSTPGR
jgi:hypothetical protein